MAFELSIPSIDSSELVTIDSAAYAKMLFYLTKLGFVVLLVIIKERDYLGIDLSSY